MVSSAESARLDTSYKEAISDGIPNQYEDDYVKRKVLERATLKIDLYLIPILGMFCVSLTQPFTPRHSPPIQIFSHSW